MIAVGLPLLAATSFAGGGAHAVPPARAATQGEALKGPFAVRTLKRRAVPPAPQHLYLTSAFEGAVYSFPLTNGIPSTTPNAVITGLSYPAGIAVDDDGYLYVSDENTHVIDVFAPGANGPAKPVRQMQTGPRNTPALMTLWDDFLFGDIGNVVVYPTGGNGPIAPLEEIAFGSTNDGLASRPDGRLYLSWNSVDLTVYNKVVPPRTSWIAPIQDIKIIPNREFSAFDYGLAVDDREIFSQLYTAGGAVQIGVFPINSNGPTKPSRVIITPACNGGPSSIMYSLAIYSRYLYEACETPVAILIYDKHGSGRVRPLFRLTGAFSGAHQLVLGP